MSTALVCTRSGNAQHKGWLGITCEGRGNGARVLVVDLPGVGVAGELLPYQRPELFVERLADLTGEAPGRVFAARDSGVAAA